MVRMTNTVREERFKFERLEEQINDLTELHQNEMENIKVISFCNQDFRIPRSPKYLLTSN